MALTPEPPPRLYTTRMRNEIRNRHAEVALGLASQDQRLLDLLSQRPHLLNPYPNIVARLSRRSRRFRKKIGSLREDAGRPVPLRSPSLDVVAGRAPLTLSGP